MEEANNIAVVSLTAFQIALRAGRDASARAFVAARPSAKVAGARFGLANRVGMVKQHARGKFINYSGR